MAVYHGLSLGMMGFYGVQDGEFPGVAHSYYPALIVGYGSGEIPTYDILVFTEVGVFGKRGVEDGAPSTVQAGKISMTSAQYDREAFADALGLNFGFFRP